MTRPLRVVKPDDDTGASVTMVEAIRDLAEKLAVQNPVAVLVAYELPPEHPGKPGKVQYLTIPAAGVVAGGFVDQLYDQMHPEPASE